MRVLVLVTEAYGGRGGIAQFNRNLCAALDQLPECTEVIVIPRILRDACGDLPDKVSFIEVAAGSKARFLMQSILYSVRDRDFDLVVCGHINLMPVAAVLGYWSGAPVLLCVHGIEAWRQPASRITRQLASNADSVLAVSQLTRERFLEWSGVAPLRCVVVPNAFDPTEFSPGKPDLRLVERYSLEGKRVLLTMARLDPDERYKGIDEVLAALPKLLTTYPELVYLVAGDGEDRTRLEQKAEKLGISEHVRFTGWVSEAEKADHYRLADAFVMAGRGEGFGIVYLEALACGVPVVGSKLDGSRDALREGKLGVLVDPDSEEDLIAGIRQALESPKGVPKGLGHFGFDRFVERLRKLLVDNSVIQSESSTAKPFTVHQSQFTNH